MKKVRGLILSLSTVCLTVLAAIGFINSYPEHVVNFESFLQSNTVTTLWENRYPLAFVLVLFIVLIVANHIRDLNLKIEDLENLPMNSRKAAQRHHDLITWLFERITTAKVNLAIPESHETLKRYIYTQLSVSLGFAADELKILTGEVCHLCLKLLNNDGSITVIARDPSGSISRGERDGVSHNYRKNTAFIRTIDYRDENFINNDLQASIKIDPKAYVNAAADWMKFYNAIFVLPITGSACTAEKRIIGFICAHNFGGGFDQKACNEVMSRYAIVYQRILEMVEEYDRIGVYPVITPKNVDLLSVFDSTNISLAVNKNSRKVPDKKWRKIISFFESKNNDIH